MIDCSFLPFERLELMDDPVRRSAALNMALDEVLLDRLSDRPLLRIYRWERASVSMGCFEPVEPVVCRWPQHDLVRRWTGGGVVVHGRDLTFSLLVPRPMGLTTLPATESYRIIHTAVATALARSGVPMATLQAGSTEPSTASRACFENPVPYDLLLAGQKIAGGAQRRTRRGLLHQGSIQNVQESNGLTPSGTTFLALAKELPQAFGRCVKARGVSSSETEAARLIMAARYAAPAWLNRF